MLSLSTSMSNVNVGALYGTIGISIVGVIVVISHNTVHFMPTAVSYAKGDAPNPIVIVFGDDICAPDTVIVSVAFQGKAMGRRECIPEVWLKVNVLDCLSQAAPPTSSNPPGPNTLSETASESNAEPALPELPKLLPKLLPELPKLLPELPKLPVDTDTLPGT